MNDTPRLTTPEQVLKRSGYQSLQPVKRPEYWGVDRDPARRPGVPMMRKDPQPFPNTRFPLERQPGLPAAPLHGRSNKQMPPVFGTSTPLRGVSGAIRKLAYSYPDHYPSHWLLKMFGDKVDSWTYHAKKYLPFALPLAGIAFIVSSRASEERRRSARWIPEQLREHVH
ncbi:hypothetical protein ACLESO_21330 [Pyxidicoccus sp. 3LG]